MSNHHCGAKFGADVCGETAQCGRCTALDGMDRLHAEIAELRSRLVMTEHLLACYEGTVADPTGPVAMGLAIGMGCLRGEKAAIEAERDALREVVRVVDTEAHRECCGSCVLIVAALDKYRAAGKAAS